MDPIITIKSYIDWGNGKIEVKTFRVKDDRTYDNIMNELQFCKLINEFTVYPDRK